MDLAVKLRMVLNTLNGVKAEGKENWDRLLGSMQAIEEVIQELEAYPAVSENTEQEVADG